MRCCTCAIRSITTECGGASTPVSSAMQNAPSLAWRKPKSCSRKYSPINDANSPDYWRPCARLPTLVGENPAAPDAAGYDRLFKRYVLDNGTVKYAALKAGLGLSGRLKRGVSSRRFPISVAQVGVLVKYVQCARTLGNANEYPQKKDRLNSLIDRYQFLLT